MGKASSNKKVARAASTGGGRTARGARPYGWYTALVVVSAIGIFLVAFSRHEQQAAAAGHPRGSDHWHMAYAIDICGTMQPNLPQNPNLTTSTTSTAPPPGLHTHGDGLIHIEPFVSGLSIDAGNHATVAQFAKDYPGFKLTSTELQYPGQADHKNGQKCNGKPAEVRLRVWNTATGSTSITYTNPGDVHVKDGEAVTIAFLPAGDDIPKPPAANISHLTTPNAQEPGASQTQTTSVITVPPTATTVAGAPGTTVAGAPANTATTTASAPPTTGGSPPTSGK
ncbi:MAG TPA: hypothetical protein VNY84_08565 [Acidimicrobiales bacterium]|nr:hypothetical protein [Acidimicrobiales bacterium]